MKAQEVLIVAAGVMVGMWLGKMLGVDKLLSGLGMGA